MTTRIAVCVMTFMPLLAHGEKIRTSATLWFDNRGGPAAVLEIGKQRFKLPANGTGKHAFKPPATDADATVLLNGEEIGHVDSAETMVREQEDQNERLRKAPGQESYVSYRVDRVYFIDTSGRRCYVEDRRDYGKYNNGWKPEPYSKKLNGARLYRIISPDYFLASAPSEVKVRVGFGGSAVDSKIELIDLQCKTPPSRDPF